MAPHSCNRRQPHVSACHCEERGGRPATGQSVLLRQGIAESSTSGEYEKHDEFARHHAVATADTRQASACHCEERGGCPATWQSASPQGSLTSWLLFGRTRYALRIRLKCCFLPCATAKRTDCRTSAIQAAYPSPRLFLRKSRGLSHSAASPSPGRTGAPRFPSCTGSQGRPPLSLRGAKRRGNPYSLRQGMAKSSA